MWETQKNSVSHASQKKFWKKKAFLMPHKILEKKKPPEKWKSWCFWSDFEKPSLYFLKSVCLFFLAENSKLFRILSRHNRRLKSWSEIAWRKIRASHCGIAWQKNRSFQNNIFISEWSLLEYSNKNSFLLVL